MRQLLNCKDDTEEVELDLREEAPVLTGGGLATLEKFMMLHPISVLKLGNVASMEFFLQDLSNFVVKTIDLSKVGISNLGEGSFPLVSHTELLQQTIENWPSVGGGGLKRLVIDAHACDLDTQRALVKLQLMASQTPNCFQIDLFLPAAPLSKQTAPIGELARVEQESEVAKNIANLLEQGNAVKVCQIIAGLDHRLTTLDLLDQPPVTAKGAETLFAIMVNPPEGLKAVKIGKADAVTHGMLTVLLPLLEALPKSKLAELDLSCTTELIFEDGLPPGESSKREVPLRPQHVDVLSQLLTTKRDSNHWTTRVLVNENAVYQSDYNGQLRHFVRAENLPDGREVLVIDPKKLKHIPIPAAPIPVKLVGAFNTGGLVDVSDMLWEHQRSTLDTELDLCHDTVVLNSRGLGALEKVLMLKQGPSISRLKLGNVVSMGIFLPLLKNYKVVTIDLRQVRIWKEGRNSSPLEVRHAKVLGKVIDEWTGGAGLRRLVIDARECDMETRYELDRLRKKAIEKPKCFQIEFLEPDAPLSEEIFIPRPAATEDEEIGVGKEVALLLQKDDLNEVRLMMENLTFHLGTLNLLNHPLDKKAISQLAVMVADPPGVVKVIKVGGAAELLPLLHALPGSPLLKLDLSRSYIPETQEESETTHPISIYSKGEYPPSVTPADIDEIEDIWKGPGMQSQWTCQLIVNSRSLGKNDRKRLWQLRLDSGAPIIDVDVDLNLQSVLLRKNFVEAWNSKKIPEGGRNMMYPKEIFDLGRLEDRLETQGAAHLVQILTQYSSYYLSLGSISEAGFAEFLKLPPGRWPNNVNWVGVRIGDGDRPLADDDLQSLMVNEDFWKRNAAMRFDVRVRDEKDKLLSNFIAKCKNSGFRVETWN